MLHKSEISIATLTYPACAQDLSVMDLWYRQHALLYERVREFNSSEFTSALAHYVTQRLSSKEVLIILTSPRYVRKTFLLFYLVFYVTQKTTKVLWSSSFFLDGFVLFLTTGVSHLCFNQFIALKFNTFYLSSDKL